MKIAFLSDVHGNSLALKNCLSFLESQDIGHIYFLGDAMGYMPHAAEVLELLQERNIPCLKGNHEAMLLGQLPLDEGRDKIYQLGHTAASFSQEQKEYISSWAEHISFEVDDKKYLLVHGSPFNHINGYIYPDTDLNAFSEVDADVIVMGHTHHPFERMLGNKRLINTGAVGLPRDVGNLSCFCIIDTEPFHVQHVRIPFDTGAFTVGTVDESVLACFERRREDFIGSENIITNL